MMLQVLSQSDAELTACFARDIAALTKSFSESIGASKQSLDQMVSSDPSVFSRAAIRALGQSTDSSGTRYVLHLLRKRNLLLPALADPVGTKSEDAVAAARVICQIGSPLDSAVEGVLSATLGERSSSANASRIVRLLDILGAASPHPRFYLFQMELLSYPDTQVRSKSALLICRSSKSATLVGRMMLDEDPRVQANAVEALWTFEAAEAGPLLLIGARSKSPRVAANAAVGLYRIGDLSSLKLLFDMAQEADPNRRTSAAWAMGETGDPRFLPFLTAWFPRSAGDERVNVLQALGRIRRREKSLAEAHPIEIRNCNASLAGADRRLVLSLWSPEEAVIRGLKPTDFAIWEGETLVQDYEVLAQENPALSISGFILPRFSSLLDPAGIAVLEGIARCLRYKRPDDLWRLDRYLTEPRPADSPEKIAFPYDDLGAFARMQQRGFLSSPEALRKIVESAGSKERAADDSIAAFDRQSDAMIKFSGKRMLFLFLSRDCARHLDRHLARLTKFVASERITLHAMAPVGFTGSEEFEQLCLKSDGGTFAILSPDRIADEVERIYAGSINRFDVTYRVPEQPAPAEGRIQITSAGGRGLTSFYFPDSFQDSGAGA
jgi:hypothetical protein